MIKLSHKIAAHNIRKNFGKGDKFRDKGQTTPCDIIRFDNILYGDCRRYKKWQLLDVYRPKNAESAKLPVIVSVHGGAWVYGDKDVYQFYCMKLAQRGFAVVNFSYRLAPEVKFPASLQDTDKVFRWIYENSEKYGFDTEKVFAVGDSAGAHLLGLYSSILTNADYALKYDFWNADLKRPKLCGIALNCGKYDMATGLDNDPQSRLLLQALMPGGGTPEELELINAAGHITKDFPPTFIMTCYGDFLYTQAPVISTALQQAGVQHEYHCYGTNEQPLWHVFHCDPKLPQAIVCNDDECNFFKKLM